MNISGFRASLATGGVRPNQFRVELNFPGFIANGATLSALGHFHCKATTVPSSTTPPIPVFFRGRPINVAGEREFQPWTVAMYNENFLLRDAMVNWSNGMNDLNDNSGILAPADYQTDISFVQLDRNGNELKVWTLHDVMPTDVGGVELDFENNNQIEIFQVQFVYNYFTESNIVGQNQSIESNAG